MKEYNVKLPCGINKDGKVVYIKDAKNGLSCECFCPGCKQALVAKNGGTKREYHFAHLNIAECEHGYQSALHYMGKDLFLEMEYFTFVKDGKSEKYKIDSVELEYKIGNIIPDILITCDGKQFIVEIFVTHAVDDEKKEKIKSLKISALEIDLSRFKTVPIDKETLKQELQNPDNFSWIYDADHDLIEQKRNIIQQFGLKIPIEFGEILACPQLANQSNQFARGVTLDFCLHCPYCVYKNGQGFIFCGKILPAVLNFETKEKLSTNIFVNENKIMFASEFKNHAENLNKELQLAVNQQFQILKSIAINQYAQACRSLSSNYSQHNSRTNNNKHNYRKRRGFY